MANTSSVITSCSLEEDELVFVDSVPRRQPAVDSHMGPNSRSLFFQAVSISYDVSTEYGVLLRTPGWLQTHHQLCRQLLV